jgi:hypothetical protein
MAATASCAHKFVAWTGYQITDAPQLGGTAPASAPEIAAEKTMRNDRGRRAASARAMGCVGAAMQLPPRFTSPQ